MVHLVALDGGLDRGGLGLVRELRRVDADHGEHVGELGLERAQLVEHVQAVAAAGRPEVEQHEPPAQPGEGQRPRGVEPVPGDRAPAPAPAARSVRRPRLLKLVSGVAVPRQK